MKFNWSQFKKAESSKTIGSTIMLDLPLLGIESLQAKVDTGAFSGALHATNIREVTSSDGVKHLRFMPLGSESHTIEIDNYHKRNVRSSNGESAIRYAIDTQVAIDGQVYPITITLADRGTMKYSMLVGRNFLRIHGFLVDVTKTNR